jgi:hypothetical protein
MSHPYLFTLTGTHPRLPVVLSLCLLMAGVPPAGAANLGDDRLPVAMDSPIERPTDDMNGADYSIFAWEIKPSAQQSADFGHRAVKVGDTRTGAGGGTSTAIHDETILQIVSGSSTSTPPFWGTNNARTGIFTDPTSNDNLNWARINDGGFKDGRFGNIIPGVAAVTSDSVSAAVNSVRLTQVRGSDIALAGILLVTSLVALLGYCAVISCTPATCCKSVTPTLPALDVSL